MSDDPEVVTVIREWLAKAEGDLVMADRLLAAKLRASDGTLIASPSSGSFPAAVAFDGANVWVVVTNDNGVRKH